MKTKLLDMKLSLKEIVKDANVLYYEAPSKPETAQKVQLENIVIHSELAMNAIDRLIELSHSLTPTSNDGK